MKVNTRICYYEFKKIQGWRYYFIRLLSGSNHTHAHLEFDFIKPFAYITIDGGPIRVTPLTTLHALDIKKYYEFNIGLIDIDIDDLKYIIDYPITNSKVMVLYQLIGRFFNMKQPTSCITFICDFLKLKGFDTPKLFTPQQLWENLHVSNNDRWTSKSR